ADPRSPSESVGAAKYPSEGNDGPVRALGALDAQATGGLPVARHGPPPWWRDELRLWPRVWQGRWYELAVQLEVVGKLPRVDAEGHAFVAMAAAMERSCEPRPWPWRRVVTQWPEDRHRRWIDRANALVESGVAFPSMNGPPTVSS